MATSRSVLSGYKVMLEYSASMSTSVPSWQASTAASMPRISGMPSERAMIEACEFGPPITDAAATTMSPCSSRSAAPISCPTKTSGPSGVADVEPDR